MCVCARAREREREREYGKTGKSTLVISKRRLIINPEPYRERVATTPFTPMEHFFTAMAARGASQKFPEVAANTCSAIEMQQNKPFATHF